jgi:hypothetical protein
MNGERIKMSVGIATFLAVYFALWPNSTQGRHPRADNEDAVYVGVIEDDRRQLDHLGPKDPTPVSGRTITPLFEKDKSGWKPVRDLSHKIKWTVAFDGKNLGTVESEPITRATLGSVTGPAHIHSILTQASQIPVVGKPEARFNGNFGRLVRRPLVVVSHPNASDPDHWKPGDVPARVMEKVRSTFRRTFLHVRQCDSSGEALSVDWSFPDSEIVTKRGYGSNKGAFIVETKLEHDKCVYNVNGNRFQSLGGNQVFYASPKNEVIYLGNDWELVDAGDYGGDGNSEVMFYVAEGDSDVEVDTEGYELFYDNFRRNVRFVWQNH